MAEIWKEIESIIDDIKKEQKEKIKKTKVEDADRVLAEIERILKPIQN